MDLSLVIATAALLITAVLAVAALRRPAPAPTVAPADVTPAIEILRKSVEELRAAQVSAMGELRTEFQRTLGATEQQLVTQSGATHKTLTDLSRQLGALAQASFPAAALSRRGLRLPRPLGVRWRESILT